MQFVRLFIEPSSLRIDKFPPLQGGRSLLKLAISMVWIIIINNRKMGKKISNAKLMKRQGGPQESMLSAFNKFANKVTESRHKKIEKIGDTKQRLMQAKKTNKMVKVSKRTSKFALLEEGENQPSGLTHRGKNISDIKQFNDMNFGSDVEDEDFEKIHENLNFTGFDEDDNAKPKDDDRPKTSKEIYKEIIEKSKLHKHLRQEIYEQNFNMAVELDEKFPQLANNLKFRNRDSNVKDKLGKVDHDYEKLANELKEDERVVSNKVIEKNEKYTDKIRKKKTEQLQSLMKDSSEDEGDIRGWVKNINENEDVEEEVDEIDDVQLSSGDEGSEEEDEIDDEQVSSGDEGSEEEDEEDEEQDESQENSESDGQDDAPKRFDDEQPGEKYVSSKLPSFPPNKKGNNKKKPIAKVAPKIQQTEQKPPNKPLQKRK